MKLLMTDRPVSAALPQDAAAQLSAETDVIPFITRSIVLRSRSSL